MMSEKSALSTVVCALVTGLVAGCSDGNDSFPGVENPIAAYYIDCNPNGPGTGTMDDPWSELATANSITLEPGEHLLLRRGTLCTGMLKPIGSGTAENLIHIGAYGEGPLPRIDAQGLHHSAVHIEDMSHLVVQDLEITNPGNMAEPHRGVYITPRSIQEHQPRDPGPVYP